MLCSKVNAWKTSAEHKAFRDTTDTHPPVKAPPELSCTESTWAGVSSRTGQRAHQLQTTIQVPAVNSSGRTTQRQPLAADLSHNWTAFCWENVLHGAGEKGMEVAALPETRNLGMKELDPQGTPAVQGVQEGRGGASQVLAAVRVQARQRGFGAQGPLFPWLS